MRHGSKKIQKAESAVTQGAMADKCRMKKQSHYRSCTMHDKFCIPWPSSLANPIRLGQAGRLHSTFCISDRHLARVSFKLLLLTTAVLSGTLNLNADTNSVTGIIGHPSVSAFIDSAQTNRLLRIGMVDCIAWTLQNNSEIIIKKIEPKLREDDEKIAKAAFEPNFYANVEKDSINSPVPMPMNVYSSVVSRAVDINAGLSGKLTTGTRYQLDLLGSRNDDNPATMPVNPVYYTEPKITITQPIFKGAGFEVNKAEIVIAANYRRISSKDLRATAMQSISRAIIAYYNYCYSQEYK